MPDANEISKKVSDLATYIDNVVSTLVVKIDDRQKAIYDMLRDEILKFEISQGSYVVGQDLRKRILIIENKMLQALRVKSFKDSIKNYLTDFTEIQNRTIELHKFSSDVSIPKSELTPAKQIIQESAEKAFTSGLASEYVEPAKQMIAKQVLTGSSINKTVDMLEKWNNGELSSGRETQGQRTPNLKKYATQMARDNAYSVQRSTNNIFKEKFGFENFIYAGGLVADSRPICKHLVKLNREISFDELPPLLQQFPEGLYPGTTKENFATYCGGYACKHLVHSVL